MNVQFVLVTNIRKLIKEKGMKQKAVAEQCGIDEKIFSNMLCNRQEIRTEILPLIAKTLDVSINDLFKTEESK